jgi:hypothetical protein
MNGPPSDDTDGGSVDDESGSDRSRGDHPVGDGGVDPGFDEAAMYVVVRDAVEDAILGVLGTLMLLGIAFVAVWAGGAAIVQSQTPVSITFGVLAIAFGFYLAASALEIVPPAREWF